MYLYILLSIVSVVSADSDCQKVDTIDEDLYDNYCGQPLFLVLAPKTEENKLLDNVCLTYFPLPDDPDTYHVYAGRVFCDGSTDIISYIGTNIQTGIFRKANPFITVTEHVIGYAGCDTYIRYVCTDFGDGGDPRIYGISFTCQPIGLSCLRKVEEIIANQGLPEQELYVLPMKLPNRCVTQQLCLQPSNPFYNQLHSVALL